MYQNILQSIARFVKLSETDEKRFTDTLKPLELPKKQHLLRAGEFCKNIYFIQKGCLRYYYLVDGEEKTGQFFFENGWYTDYESFLSGQPSLQYVEALEETELFVLEKQKLEYLYNTVPKFERFGRIMAEQAYLGIRRRTKGLTNLSATERYEKLVKERPKIMERVPQLYIASYLNIKPQSLSRIRKNLVKG